MEEPSETKGTNSSRVSFVVNYRRKGRDESTDLISKSSIPAVNGLLCFSKYMLLKGILCEQ